MTWWSPGRRAARATFALYALVLATATHWPDLTIEGPIDRPDLVLHFTAFAAWSGLLAWSRVLGRSPLGVVLLVSAGYACLDEGTQGIPILGRTVGLDDLLANLAGACVGGSVGWSLARRACPGPTHGGAVHGA